MAKTAALPVSTLRYFAQSAYRTAVMRGNYGPFLNKTVQGVKLMTVVKATKGFVECSYTDPSTGREVIKNMKIARSWL